MGRYGRIPLELQGTWRHRAHERRLARNRVVFEDEYRAEVLAGIEAARQERLAYARQVGSRRPIEDWEVPYLEELGAAIRGLRTALGWNQERLAVAAGIRRPSLSKIERGVRRTRQATLRKLATALTDALAAGQGWDAQEDWHDHERQQAIDELMEEWVELAGPSLAPPSVFEEKMAAKKERQAANQRRWAEQAAERDRLWRKGPAAG